MKNIIDVDLREDQLALKEVQDVLQNPDKFIVTKQHVKGGTGLCSVCKQQFGTPHLLSCSLVFKNVMVRVTAQYPVETPCHWTKEFIEYHKLDSTPQGLLEAVRYELSTILPDKLAEYGQHLTFECLDDQSGALLKHH
ncbi:hypothetical protein [Desulfogranum marinum]|uniref:hypothetical protein n=1 Tax=Desulfogranum marinum TaxID=453220 RepID=UPI00196640C8|nr:hypothetical protein [Desulfogranum marinum]MBM9514709.1 hypothetical protein [Desulfogranum marinum]